MPGGSSSPWPSPRGLEAATDKELPEVVQPDFKTTVDKADYRG